MMNRLFINHCAESGETYFQHLAFTARTATELVATSVALVVHGLIPALFTTTASGRIARLHDRLAARAAKIASRKAA